MTEQKQDSNVNVEMAKQLGKAALKGGIDTITGKTETGVLCFFVIFLRVIGVVLFLCAVFQIWFFDSIAHGMKYSANTSSFVVWLKVSGMGFLFGMLVYGTAEVVALLQKMERHLGRLSGKS